MKTFSLASVTGALLFTSSLASADPGCGRDFFHGRGAVYPRGGPAHFGIVMRSPLAMIAPRAFYPPPAAVYAPRREVYVQHSAYRPQGAHVNPAPAPAPVSQPAPSNAGSGRPSKPGGQGNGSGKPPRPAQ